jgi:hypothetical protein
VTPVIEPVASKFELLTSVGVQELAIQEDAPCGLEKPITKQRTNEQKGNKIRRSNTSLFVTAKTNKVQKQDQV